MGHNPQMVTTVADKVRKILIRQLTTGGWNATTLAAEMQRRGHVHWNANIVNAASKERGLYVDECISLLGIFKGNAKVLLNEVDAITEEIVKLVETR